MGVSCTVDGRQFGVAMGMTVVISEFGTFLYGDISRLQSAQGSQSSQLLWHILQGIILPYVERAPFVKVHKYYEPCKMRKACNALHGNIREYKMP